MATLTASSSLAIASVGAAWGAVAVGLIAALFVVCAMSGKVRAFVDARWGRSGRGVPISAFGHLAWAVNALGWVMVLASQAFAWGKVVQYLLFGLMLCAVSLLFLACWKDSAAARREKAG